VADLVDADRNEASRRADDRRDGLASGGAQLRQGVGGSGCGRERVLLIAVVMLDAVAREMPISVALILRNRLERMSTSHHDLWCKGDEHGYSSRQFTAITPMAL